MRGDQLARQWRLIVLLSGRPGRTLDQLRAELGVTKRTIQRDLAVLEAAGFAVESKAGGGGLRWRLMDSVNSSAELSFTVAELMALYFSRGLLRALHGSPMEEALAMALEKIGGRLPASSHALLRGMQQQTAVSVNGWKDYSRSTAAIRALNRAVRRRLTVRFAHRPAAGEAKSRTVDPYRLWYAGGGLYLVAYDHVRRAVRTFAVERIGEVTMTRQRFAVLDTFDFEAYTRTAFPVHGGEPKLVRIRFSPEQTPYVLERHWHDSQRFLPQEDGGVVMELQVGNLWEVKRWLIGWGGDAMVIEPVELAEEILGECRLLLNRESLKGGGCA